MEAKVYLVTHGETALDLEGRMHGQTVDAPLSLKGWLTANQVARKLKGKGITRIYSSPLKRAQETARVIGKTLGVPVVVKQELLPMHIGRMGGAKVDAIKPLLEFFSRRPDRKIPGGESKNAFLGRWKGFLHKVGRERKTIAIAGHSQHALALEHARNGGDPSKVPLTGGEPGAIHTVKFW